MRSITLLLPDSLAEQAEAYAAQRGTTIDALVCSQLKVVLSAATPYATLKAYSQGHLSRAEAIRDLGLRDHAALLVALGDAGLGMPRQDPADIERQAEMFERIWRAL